MPRFNEDGFRLCDQANCDFLATHTLVWSKQQHYCQIHLQTAANIAQAMGFNAALATIRPMTPDEMMPEEPTDGPQET